MLDLFVAVCGLVTGVCAASWYWRTRSQVRMILEPPLVPTFAPQEIAKSPMLPMLMTDGEGQTKSVFAPESFIDECQAWNAAIMRIPPVQLTPAPYPEVRQ